MSPPTTRFPGAVVLGQYHGIAFIQTHAVLAVAGERVQYHCAADAWDGSPEARAILLDLQIATKRQELNDLLERRGAVHALGDLRAAPRALTASAGGTRKPRTARRYKRYRCLVCGEVVGNLGMHGKYHHPGVSIEGLRGEEVDVDAELAASEKPTQAPAPDAPSEARREADPK
jgi:hypothetical protein